MELNDYINILLKRKWMIIIITAVATIASFIISSFVITKIYTADISVIIGQEAQANKGASQTFNDVMMYKQMVKTYGEFTKSRKVLDDVISKLNLDMSVNKLASMVSVSPKADTEFLSITVKSEDRYKSRDIANQIALSLKEKTKEVKKVDNVQTLDDALLPTTPSSPRIKVNVAMAFVVGLLGSIGIAFLLEYLDNTIKTDDEIEKLLGIPVVGTIPMMREK